MTPNGVTNSIVQAILQGGMQWVVSTIAAFMPALWALTVIFHLARPYVLRTVRKLSLRFGADIWWLGYVLIRDAVMLITFALSTIFLFPNLLLTIPLPLTAPLAALLLFASLYVKLLYDTDEDFQAYRVATLLLAIGGALYLVPQIFAIEFHLTELVGRRHKFPHLDLEHRLDWSDRCRLPVRLYGNGRPDLLSSGDRWTTIRCKAGQGRRGGGECRLT